MWFPKTAQELVDAINNRTLPHEATVFEVKKQPPVAAKNSDMAVDVAAMSTDGGVIIYGVDEDRATDTFTPTPFPLAGFKERISEVVASNTREPIEFAVHELPLDSDPSEGFVVVVVPASLRAPHMVESKGQYHYYGRIPGGNRILGQADVALLYERRQRVEDAALKALEEAIQHAAIPPVVGRADLHLVALPLVSDSGLRERAMMGRGDPPLMNDVHEAFRAVRFKDRWDPNFADIGLGCVPSSTIDGIALTNPPIQHEGQDSIDTYVSRFELSDNGTCRYFHAALGDHADDQFILRDNPVAQIAAHFCMMAGTILARGGYFGAVEVLIAVLNAGGATSGEWLNSRHFPRASRPILERQPDFDPSVLGWAMSAFFGGRAECRIRKTPLPVVYVDFLSMYPTVNALMGTWKLVTAQRVAVHDVSDKVRRLLAHPDLLDRCFRHEFWPELIGLVEVLPDGDVLPVRAAYDPASPDFGIGVNPYRKGGTAWYSIPDVVASVLLSGRVPAIRRAIRFRGVGRQGGLVPLAIRGMVEVEPAEDDFFRQVIELRHTVKNDVGRGAGEAARLSGFLKVLANSSGYGIAAEFVRHEEPVPVTVDVFADRETTFEARTEAPEEHGPYCFPPLAATITGAARLMLAVLERLVTDAGGSYVFCDTDSMAIVADRGGGLHPCVGGQARLSAGAQAVRALSWRHVDDIVDRFAALNPYDRWAVPGSILKIEKENLDTRGRRRQLWCWAISSKRYVLYTLKAGEPVIERLVDEHEEASAGEPELAKVSEHGLGHLLNPLDPEDSSVHWIELAWTYLLRKALGLPAPEPEWLNRPALTRVTVSSPAVLHWFSGMNKGHPYAGQVKPANFLLLAQILTCRIQGKDEIKNDLRKKNSPTNLSFGMKDSGRLHAAGEPRRTRGNDHGDEQNGRNAQRDANARNHR